MLSCLPIQVQIFNLFESVSTKILYGFIMEYWRGNARPLFPYFLLSTFRVISITMKGIDVTNA